MTVYSVTNFIVGEDKNNTQGIHGLKLFFFIFRPCRNMEKMFQGKMQIKFPRFHNKISPEPCSLKHKNMWSSLQLTFHVLDQCQTLNLLMPKVNNTTDTKENLRLIYPN